MTEQESIQIIKHKVGRFQNDVINDALDVAIKALEEVQQYLEIGTVEEIKEQLAELERWHTDHVNKNIKNPFAWTSSLVCHNCDHKDDYIEELEAEIEEYQAIGTPEECRAAVDKMKPKRTKSNFKECRYCADDTCKDTNRYNGCMHQYYKAAYNKLLDKGNYEDQKYPEIKGYYILLAYDKKQRKLVEIGGRWNGKEFEGIDDSHTIIAWQRCS